MFKEYSVLKVNSQWRDCKKLDLNHKALSFLALLFTLHNKMRLLWVTKSFVLSAIKTAHLPCSGHNPFDCFRKCVEKGKTYVVMLPSGNRLSNRIKLSTYFFPPLHPHNFWWVYRWWEWLHCRAPSSWGLIMYSGLLRATESSLPCWLILLAGWWKWWMFKLCPNSWYKIYDFKINLTQE